MVTYVSDPEAQACVDLGTYYSTHTTAENIAMAQGVAGGTADSYETGGGRKRCCGNYSFGEKSSKMFVCRKGATLCTLLILQLLKNANSFHTQQFL